MEASKKRRRPIADSEKKALRDYYFATCSGKASYEKCQQWFLDRHDHKLAPSSISEILKAAKYVRLDEDSAGRDSKRRTPSRWPGLEIALFAWQKRTERKTLAITGDVIRATAAKLWS
jgi:hypothetical protein